MQGNYAALILLVVAVLIFARIKARRVEKEDEEGADAQGGESLETPDGAPSQSSLTEPVKMENPEVSWEDCQRQLEEEPPLEACDRVEFPPDEAVYDSTLAPESEVPPLPESRHEANRKIRREAGRLFRENYGKILPLALIIVALMAVRLYAPLITLPEPWFTGWSFFNLGGLAAALLAPMVTLGAAYAALRIWKGEAPRPFMIFRFLHYNRYFPALFMMLIQTMILAISYVAIQLVIHQIELFYVSIGLMPWQDEYNYPFLAATILYFAVRIWLIACLTMASFAMARQSVLRIFISLGAGFRAVHRNFKRVLGMLIAVGWPFAVSSLAQLRLVSWSNTFHTDVFSRAAEILNLMLILFYGGYFMLSMAGLAEHLLPNTDAASAEPPADASTPNNSATAQIAPVEEISINAEPTEDISAESKTNELAADTGEPAGGIPENESDTMTSEVMPVEAAQPDSADNQ